MICLFMASHSGSTMVTSIFEEHGLAVRGDINKENEALKKWVKQNCTFTHHQPKFVKPAKLEEFRKLVNRQGIDVWKGGIELWPMWQQFDPKMIFIKRKIESVAKSLMAKNESTKDLTEAKRAVRKRYNLMNQVISKYGGVTVKTDELIEGKLDSLEEAFEYCDIQFKPGIAQRIIDPSRWHY